MTWQTTNTAKGDNKLYSDAKGVVPSLDLRFASQKNLNDYMTGTPLVDHQRSMSGSNLSPGTFVNSSGLIETAKVNLVTYSEEINFWSSSGILPFGSGSVVDATEAPNGTQTADLITSANATSLQYVQNTTNYAGPHIFSVYLKDNGARYVQISTNQHGSVYIVNIDLQTGITSPAGLSENAGNGWYRVFYTLLTLDGSGDHRITLVDSLAASRNSSFTGDGTSGIYIWGAQLEEGTTATTYIPTTNVPSAAPRFDHNPTTGESLGLLIEESRTNELDYSEIFTQPAWSNVALGTGSSPQVTSSAEASPGLTSPTRLVCNLNGGTTSGDISYIQKTSTYTANQTGTIYLKSNTGSNQQVYFRVGVTVSIVTVTPTWQRFEVKETSFSGGGNFNIGTRGGFGSDDSIDILIWGAQVETGSFATSYIPTTGTALTRSADVASITGANFSSWYNQSEGTVFADFKGMTVRSSLTFDRYVSINGANTNLDEISLFTQTASGGGAQNKILCSVVAAGTSQTNLLVSGQGPDFGGKAVIGYAQNNIGFNIDGATTVNDTSALLPTATQLQIFGQSRFQPKSSGRIKRLTYFPERLPDATLQAITA